MQRHSSDSDECEFHQIHSDMATSAVEQAETISGYLKNAVTNLAYNLKHSNYLNIPLLQRQKIVLREGGEPACYFGRLYSIDSLQQFNEHFRNTLWLSYRKGIKDIGDDRGWGCMIRAVQMLMAEAMKRLCGYQGNRLIDQFREAQTSVLSLVNICRAGGICTNFWRCREAVDVSM